MDFTNTIESTLETANSTTHNMEETAMHNTHTNHIVPTVSFKEFITQTKLTIKLPELSGEKKNMMYSLLKQTGCAYFVNECSEIASSNSTPGENIGSGDAPRMAAVRKLIDEDLTIYALADIASPNKKRRIPDAVRLNAMQLLHEHLEKFLEDQGDLTIKDAIILLVNAYDTPHLTDVKNMLLKVFDETDVIVNLFDIFERGFLDLYFCSIHTNPLTPQYDNYIANLITPIHNDNESDLITESDFCFDEDEYLREERIFHELFDAPDNHEIVQ